MFFTKYRKQSFMLFSKYTDGFYRFFLIECFLYKKRTAKAVLICYKN